MHSFRESSRAWPLSLCVLAGFIACHSDEIAGTKLRSDAPALAVAPTVGFIWCVQGHPGVQAAYEGSGPQLTAQLNYLNTLRARYYRIDLRTDSAGNVILPTTFNGILDAADARGIKVLPALVMLPDAKATQASNYNRGYSIGRNFAARYRGRFTHIEAGNELDNFALNPGDPEGTSLTHFNDSLLRKTTSFLRGMTVGIHDGAPGTGVVIDAGFLHYAFFQALDRDGVPYDVYGYHWYSDMEDHGTFAQRVLPNLTNASKEIWLTEANRGNQEGLVNDPIDQADKISRYVREFHAMPRVKALFIYELFEEKVWLNPPGGQTPNPPQAYFGIVGCPDSDIGCANRSLKPGFDAYRYGIEERRFGYEDYVYSLYVHLNRRNPDASGLAFWTNRFKASPTDTLGLINTFIPEESYKVFIKEQFVALLDRALTASQSDQAGLAYWNDRMKNGLTRRGLIVEFCGTPEFWAKAGSTNAGFVDRLYLKLLRKSSSTDPSGRQYWINRMAAGMHKWDVADAFLSGTAYQTLFVQDQFVALLDRNPRPSASVVAPWVTKMQQGWGQEAVIRAFLLTPEFVSKAIISGYGRRS